MSIFIFSQYFLQKILPGGKVWGYPTLLISSFINFNNFFNNINVPKESFNLKNVAGINFWLDFC